MEETAPPPRLATPGGGPRERPDPPRPTLNRTRWDFRTTSHPASHHRLMMNGPLA